MKLVLNYPGVDIKKIHKADSPNYLFIDLQISNSTLPGTFKIEFNKGQKKLAHNYKIDETEETQVNKMKALIAQMSFT